MPHTAFCMRASGCVFLPSPPSSFLEVNQAGYNAPVLTKAWHNDVYRSGEQCVEQRTRARMRSWNCRTIARAFPGTLKRAIICHTAVLGRQSRMLSVDR